MRRQQAKLQEPSKIEYWTGCYCWTIPPCRERLQKRQRTEPTEPAASDLPSTSLCVDIAMLAPLIYLLNFTSKKHQLCRTSGCDAVLWSFFTSRCHSDFLLIWKCSKSALFPVCWSHCISWTWQWDWGMQVWVVSSYERDVEGVCKEPGDWLQVLISLRSQIKSHDFILSIQLEGSFVLF